MPNKMISPFENDPFCLVAQAYQNLFGKPYVAYFDQHDDYKRRKHRKEYGFTVFESGYLPEIHIFAEHSINIQVETFAHELAHVAMGPEHDHDEVWDKAFEDIKQEYDRLGIEMFANKTEGIQVEGGDKSEEGDSSSSRGDKSSPT